MLSDGILHYGWSQDVLTPGTADSYLQCPRSSTGASLLKEERKKILMFIQQRLTQILEGIQADLKQYSCFLDPGHLSDTAFLWQNLDDPEGALRCAHPCNLIVLIQNLRNSWVSLQPFARWCTLLWGVCTQEAMGLWSVE